mmetsp:Transcript_13690/g.34430  ORF Transcript_13690/g.34430 Transcript_13690/m.34430 type:complete len:821 (+) Transcript_13690:219-2681(+)
MSSATRQTGASVTTKGGKGRKTRAGNDLDAFPFDKLSVDGAALAKMMISPLPNPAFRTRDPLDSRDSTSSTVQSSDEDSPASDPKLNKEIAQSDDQFEEVEITPKTEQTASPSSNRNFAALKSPDPPEAKHIKGIFQRSGSNVKSSDSDSYYEVYDSPGAEKNYSYRMRNSETEYYSDVVSSSGWESGMSLTDEAPDTPKKQMPPRKERISQKRKKKVMAKQALMKNSLANSPVDPDGANFHEDNLSTTGEDLVPTPDLESTLQGSRKMYDSSKRVRGAQSSSSSEEIVEYESEIDDMSFDDVESPPPSVSNEKVAPRSSTFPSYRFLVCMAVTIGLVTIGLIAGLSWYFWERTPLDPLCPPDDYCCNNPHLCSASQPTFDGKDGTPLIPTDEELLKLFESVVGEAVTSDFTSAGMAANWMLNEDPGKLLKPRSDQAWIQRYLLVYTYYATTLNRSTTWLSCNPPTEDELKLDDIDTCMFTNPTELPGGNVIYDMVPAYRWLSAADECQWGGVACGKTVVDEITIDTDGKGSNVPIKSTMKRLAVTSIVLADQNLKGSIVTELTVLPMLQVLDLSHNELQGTVSEGFGSLQTLRLQYNALQGNIPKNLFSSKSVMKELNIGSNFMTGTIPDEVGLASQMTDLYLFGNKFTGSIPRLGNMPIVNFHAQENDLSGVMPFDYGYDGPWTKTLQEWWVYDNKLTGPLSSNLGFVTNLEDMRVNNNELTGSIPESIEDLQRLFRFDLHMNSLTGTIPESIGSLPQLRDLRLQFNDFGGVVPSSLCFLESMEVLEADCLAFVGEPQTDCYCCTTCCNPDLGGCQFY